jgi:hypothetical protein
MLFCTKSVDATSNTALVANITPPKIKVDRKALSAANMINNSKADKNTFNGNRMACLILYLAKSAFISRE